MRVGTGRPRGASGAESGALVAAGDRCHLIEPPRKSADPRRDGPWSTGIRTGCDHADQRHTSNPGGLHMARSTHIRHVGVALLATMALVLGACGASGGDEKGSDKEGSTTTAAGSSTGSEWGTLPSPCGKGSFKVAEGEGGTGTDKLYIGVPNDRGAAIRPGLNKELWDASVAFT